MITYPRGLQIAWASIDTALNYLFLQIPTSEPARFNQLHTQWSGRIYHYSNWLYGISRCRHWLQMCDWIKLHVQTLFYALSFIFFAVSRWGPVLWYGNIFPDTICCEHYNDVIMNTMASQITSLTIVYSSIYPDTGQRKYQSSASLAFVRGFHRWPVNSSHKGQ